MTDSKKWLVVGLITSPHGINGRVNVKSLSDFNERFITPGKRWLQKDCENPTAVELISGYQKPGRDNFIVNFKEISTRNQAENYKEYKVLVESSNIPKLKVNEFHISELLKLEVKQEKNNKLEIIGEVYDLSNEKNNLLVIKLFAGNKLVLIPFVKEIVSEVNLKEKYILINPPKGLLEL